jgi:putrescine---pyruvate transaminase
MIELGSFVKPSIKPEQIEKAHDYIIYLDGKPHIDTMSGLWCTPLGYSVQSIKDRIYSQLNDLPFYNNYFESQCKVTEEYAERLCSIAEMDRVYFSLSGSAAVETAIKLAHHQRPTGKCCVFKRSYHGASVLSGYTSDYDLHSFHKLKAPIDVYYYESGIDLSDMSFVLIEPIICAGGVHKHDDSIWQDLVKYQLNGGIVIFDETVTGFGKTGTMFAKQWALIEPDIMILGKAITNGYMPYAATLMKKKMLPSKTFEHGYTCSGHPAASAAALAMLDELDKIKFRDDYMGAFQFNSIRAALKFKKNIKKAGYITELSSSDPTRVVYCLPYILTEEDKKTFFEACSKYD